MPIQDSINNALNSILSGTAATIATTELAEQRKLQKEEATFNAKMKQAELPSQKTMLEMEASEASQKADLTKVDKQERKALKKLEKAYNESPVGPYDEDLFYQNKADIKKEANQKRSAIQLKYEEKSAKLSAQLLKEQVQAKKTQAKIISERREELEGKPKRGGKR